MGDRVIVLNQGSILQIAEPEKIFNFPKNDFVGGLVGDPPMNFSRVFCHQPLRELSSE